MNIEDMKDGKYVLLMLNDYPEEFEIEVKGKERTITRNAYGKVTPVKEDEFSLLCDIYETDLWQTEEGITLQDE